ncbi:MAG: hypothetical protein J1F17_00695 [Oscillospiraceae bacterium]|nr:hypothetical protein [Oscillospiraceae bacterium]
MKEKNIRKKVQIGIITFGVLFFFVLGMLTYFSSQIDSLLYPVVTAATSSTGKLNPPPDYIPEFDYNTLVPSSAVKGNKVQCLRKNQDGTYTVYYYEAEIVDSNAVQTELAHTGDALVVVCNSTKELKDGDKVLVRAGVL